MWSFYHGDILTASNRFFPDSGRTNNVSLYLQEVLWGRGEGKRVKKEKKRICKLMKLLKKDTYVRSEAQGLRIVSEQNC